MDDRVAELEAALTAIEIEELEKATPGPWEVSGICRDDGYSYREISSPLHTFWLARVLAFDVGEDPHHRHDASLIAAAPQLLALVRQMRAALRERDTRIADLEAMVSGLLDRQHELVAEARKYFEAAKGFQDRAIHAEQRAEAEKQEREEDKARLDWLENFEAVVNRRVRLWTVTGWDGNDCPQATGETLRAAIDAARGSAQEVKSDAR